MALNTDRLTPFAIQAHDEALRDLTRRLEAYRAPSRPEGGGWTYGVDGDYLARLIAYWRDDFDWRAAEQALNALPHFWASVRPPEGPPLRVHLIVSRAAATDAPVVLLTPGWPSSLVEFQALIPRLTHPERFGGSASQAVSVVAAELPGFGLSERPRRPMSHRTMAGLWRQLMVEGLDVPRFHAHGGDWGAVVSSWLAFDHPDAVASLHLSMLGLRPSVDRAAAPLDETELAWLAATKQRLDADHGYSALQASKPTTLAVGLADSPAALAAWMIEKFHGWSGANLDAPPPFTADQLLTAVTLYWLLGDLGAANWIYWADRHEGDIGLGRGERIETPTALALFGQGFFPIPPRTWAERAYRITQWSEHDTGGHFPAWLRPDLLAPTLLEQVARHPA